MATGKEDRLLSQLNGSGLQIKDIAVYQVIKQLIDRIRSLEGLVDSGVGSGGTSTITTVVNGTPGPPGMRGSDGSNGMIGPVGERGITGAAGADGISNIPGPSGPITIGPMGINGRDGLNGFPIPGNNGATGLTGDTGPAGPLTMGPMGMHGRDGLMGFPIPGPAGASASNIIEAWEGHIVGCWGNGDPSVLVRNIQWGGIAPSPVNISNAVARVSYFRLATAITVANIRWFGVGNNTGLYHVAIYRQSDNVRISVDNTINTATNTWGAAADVFTLDANELYYVAVSGSSTGVAGIAAYGAATKGTTTGDMRLVGTSWPGGMDLNRNPPYLTPYMIGAVVVVASVLPDPGNAPSHASGWGAGMPAIWLDAE